MVKSITILDKTPHDMMQNGTQQFSATMQYHAPATMALPNEAATPAARNDDRKSPCTLKPPPSEDDNGSWTQSISSASPERDFSVEDYSIPSTGSTDFPDVASIVTEAATPRGHNNMNRHQMASMAANSSHMTQTDAAMWQQGQFGGQLHSPPSRVWLPRRMQRIGGQSLGSFYPVPEPEFDAAYQLTEEAAHARPPMRMMYPGHNFVRLVQPTNRRASMPARQPGMENPVHMEAPVSSASITPELDLPLDFPPLPPPPPAMTLEEPKPLRPRSAYNFFYREERLRLIKEVKHKIPLEEMTTKIASRWRALSEKDRSKYKKAALEDKKRYKTALEDYKKRQQERLAARRRQQEAAVDRETWMRYFDNNVRSATEYMNGGNIYYV